MSMSSRTYRDVAEMIRRHLAKHDEENSGAAFLAVTSVANDLADYFMQDNPDRFDYNRFLRACGLMESSQ